MATEGLIRKKTGSLRLDYYGPMSLCHHFFKPQRAFGLLLAAASALTFGQSPAPEAIRNSPLNGEIFYELLVGEISAQSGDNGSAFAFLLDAARKAKAANVYERAVQVAIAGRNGDAALQAAQAWTRAFPGSVDANRYLVQILISLNKMSAIVAPLKRDLAVMVDADKLATIDMLRRYLAQAADGKSALTTAEQVLANETSSPKAGPLAWAVIGQLRLQAGDKVGAVAAARRGTALNPMSSAPATLALALLQASVADAEGIVADFLAGTPTPEYRVAYIRYLVGVQRMAAAYEQTLVLTAQTPNFAEGWLLRGSLELQDKKNETAATALTTYVQLRAAAEVSRPARGFWTLARRRRTYGRWRSTPCGAVAGRTRGWACTTSQWSRTTTSWPPARSTPTA